MRLIDADELLAQMIGMNDGWFDPRPAYDHESLIKIQPTVDAAPVKHGRWIEEKPNSYTRITKCSVCGESAPFICKSDDYYGVHMYGETEKTTYCPGCGAKMDLEEQHD